MNSVPQVVNCSVVGPTSVRLEFHDGWTGTLDLCPALRGPIFGALKHPERFRELAVQDGTLVWRNGADICPSVLRYWCAIGRVCSQQELDAHFAAPLPVEKVCHPAAGAVAETPAKYRKKR